LHVRVKTILLAALLCGPSAQAPSTLAAEATTVTLPPGPAADAWATATSDTIADELAEAVREFGATGAWERSETWSKWSELVRAARAASDARASLVAAAQAQGRDEDAWDHFAALRASPGTLVALLPTFAPGVPIERLSELQVGAQWKLPDGVELSPRLPPLDRPASERLLGLGRLERRSTTVAGLRIGEAVVVMRIGVEQDGVQVDFDNVRGGEASCSIRLPEALDFELATAYLDWEKLPSAREPVVVRLVPGAPTVSVYGRFLPRQVRWPMTLPERMDQRAQRNGFTLVCGTDDSECARVRGFAIALTQLVGVDSVAESLELGAPTSNVLATRIDLSPSPDRARKFRALISAAEHWALTH